MNPSPTQVHNKAAWRIANKSARLFASLVLLGSLTACATSNHPRDPLEGFNRAMFSFNDAVDKVALKPAATVYQKVTPSFFQTAVGNFFGNLSDIWTAVNNLLQGKVKDGMSDVGRVALNSTFGLGGVLDIASEAGMTKHKEDFGQTLGKWGVASGPYIVLPLLGPSTLRDTAGLPLDMRADVWNLKKPKYIRNTGTALRVIDQRAAVLDAGNLLDEAALDRYEFVRDGFLQRRENKVFDGEVPPQKEDGGSKDKSSAAPALQQNASVNGAAVPAQTALAAEAEVAKAAPVQPETAAELALNAAQLALAASKPELKASESGLEAKLEAERKAAPAQTSLVTEK